MAHNRAGPMSALGQKQTYAVQQPMSALHPIATTKADMCQSSCLLYPRKRTCAAQNRMSALGQKRTHAAQQTASLFDHLVGAGEYCWRDCQPLCPCGLEIYHKLKFRGLHHREISGFRALEDPADIDATLAIEIGETRSVTHQTSGVSKIARIVNRRQCSTLHQCDDLATQVLEERIRSDHQRIGL